LPKSARRRKNCLRRNARKKRKREPNERRFKRRKRPNVSSRRLCACCSKKVRPWLPNLVSKSWIVNANAAKAWREDMPAETETATAIANVVHHQQIATTDPLIETEENEDMTATKAVANPPCAKLVPSARHGKQSNSATRTVAAGHPLAIVVLHVTSVLAVL